MAYIEDVISETRKANGKLEKIEKLVKQNRELFMDGIGEEILDIIKA